MDYVQRTEWLIQTWSRATDPPDVLEQARSEIMSLNDLGYFEPLKLALLIKRDTPERKTIYLMLTSLLSQSGDCQVGEFMMEQLAREKSKELKRKLLQSIGLARGKGVVIADASNALACLPDKLLKQDAVRALGCCSDVSAEHALLNLLAELLNAPAQRQSANLIEVLASLYEIGNSRAVAAAIPMVSSLLANLPNLEFGLKDQIKEKALKLLSQQEQTLA